jgi:hypothetical protein
LRKFREAHGKTHLEPARRIEQRLRVGTRHFRLIELIDLALIFERPTRKKRGQRHFRKHRKFGSRRRLLEEMHQAAHRLGTRGAALNRTGLACRQREISIHEVTSSKTGGIASSVSRGR